MILFVFLMRDNMQAKACCKTYSLQVDGTLESEDALLLFLN
jgi:hypothetical protein